MEIDAPALCAGFCRPDGQGNNAIKYPQLASVGVAEQLNNLPRVVGPHIRHGDEDTRDLQSRIDFPFHI